MSSNVSAIGWPKKIGKLALTEGSRWSSLSYHGEDVYGMEQAVVRVDWTRGADGGFEIEYDGELPSGQYVSAYATRKTEKGAVDLIRRHVRALNSSAWGTRLK